jgi:hypothetical protein
MEYHNFWPGFVPPNTHTAFFEYVFQDVLKTKKVRLYSIFGGQDPIIRGTDILNICFSGEPVASSNAGEFDLNIVMRHDTPKSVIYPLFAVVSYACDYWRDYTLPRCDPSFNTKFCSFVVSNENSIPRRKFFRLLCQYKKVDSMGYCDNNTGIRAPPIPNVNGGDIRHPAYLDSIRGYKFMICFENAQHPYYLTEKLLNAWLCGAVPIYWGSSKALEWLNPDAFLYLPDDSDESMIALANRIISIDQNPSEYAKIHAQPLLRSPTIPADLDKNMLRNCLNARLLDESPGSK